MKVCVDTSILIDILKDEFREYQEKLFSAIEKHENLLSPTVVTGDKRRKDTPKFGLDFLSGAIYSMEGEESISLEISPTHQELIFSVLLNREGDTMFFLMSDTTETYLELKTDNPAALNQIASQSDLARQMLSGDYIEISTLAYQNAYKSFLNITRGDVEWATSSKEIELVSIPIEIGITLGISLGFKFQTDIEKVIEYDTAKGLILPDKGMIQTQMYQKDSHLTDNIRGFSTVIQPYVEILDQAIDEVLETLVKLKEAGKELLIETKDTLVAGGAKIKAGATAIASGVKLKISKLIGSSQRSYRIPTRDLRGTSLAATVGSVFIVSAEDDAGKLLSEFTENLELTIGYTDADLTAAGFAVADASKLKIFRWDSESGYYEYIGGAVNTTDHFVTALISKPGQYVLAIDQEAPQIAEFRVTPGTLTPSIQFTAKDALSGIQPSTFSVRLDGSEIVTSENYASIFNVLSGVFEWQAQSPLAKGSHSVAVKISDTVGNVNEQTFPFTVNDSPPVITHTPVAQYAAGTSLTIRADVADDEGAVQGVLLLFRAKTAELPFMPVEMTDPSGTGSYSGVIPKEYLTSFGVRYFIRAVDKSGNQTDSPPADIAVSDSAGPAIVASPSMLGDPDGVKLIWTPSPDADTAGYKVYLGKTADALTLYQDVGNTTWIALDETHSKDYISVSAYDSAGNEGVKTAPVKIESCRLADLDCSGQIDLADAILCLKLISGIAPDKAVNVMADVNADMTVGLEEAVYILQHVGGIRQ